MNTAELNEINEKALRATELEKLPAIDFDELTTQVKKWMLIVDPGIIKFVCASYIANHLSRDPVWVFIIGPSGGGKTELLGGLLDLPDIYPISLLTPNTFLSGMPGKGDSSLLPKINGKILFFKDWTSVLSMNKDARADIMGQFREIYDGQFKKPFGNGKVREWKGKIGLIACTTPSVDLSQQMHATLGERFINYRLITPERKLVAKRASKNGDHQAEMRKALRNAFYSFFKGIDNKQEVQPIPEEAEDHLIDVVNFATMARSGVIRDFGFKKEVIFVPAVEMPTRMTQQLKTLVHAFMIINQGEYKPEDMDIIYKIALDSIPQTNRMVCLEMAAESNQTTKEIASRLGYPTAPIHMYLENLAMLGVCDRKAGKDTDEGGTADRWNLKPEFTEILQRYEKISPRIKEVIDTETAIKDVFPAETFIEDSTLI